MSLDRPIQRAMMTICTVPMRYCQYNLWQNAVKELWSFFFFWLLMVIIHKLSVPSRPKSLKKLKSLLYIVYTTYNSNTVYASI